MDLEEMLEELKVFVPKLINACESVSELFYEEMTEQSWSIFGQVFAGIDDLYRTLKVIEVELSQLHNPLLIQYVIIEFNSNLSLVIAQLNEHSDAEEYIAVGDCIKHEISPLIKHLAISLGEEKAIQDQRMLHNINFFKVNYPDVYNHLQEAERDESSYQTVHAQDGSSNIALVDSNLKVTYLYSQYNPSYEAQRWSESIAAQIGDRQDSLMYGLGLGYHLIEFAQKFPSVKIFLLEPDVQVLLAAMKVVDFQELFSKVNIKAFAVGKKTKAVEQLLYLLCYQSVSTLHIIGLPIYNRLYKENKQELLEELKFVAGNYISSAKMYDLLGIQLAKNSLLNIAVNLATPSLIGLKNRFKGMAAVIIGAGPSLEADIDYIKQIKNHAILIAAGSSIQSLIHYGVQPHLIISMDPASVNYFVFRDLETTHIPLLYIPQIEQRIIANNYENAMHAFFAHDEITNYLMDVKEADPVFVPNSSVTGTAIQAAIYMGFKEIIFTGQDLSYPNEAFYAKGAKHISQESLEKSLSKAKETVENVQGTMNRTSYEMMLTLKDIEKLIESYSGIRFTNTTQLGAVIKHTTWESMNETIQRLQATAITETIMKDAMKQHLELYTDQKIEDVISRLNSLPLQIEIVLKHFKSISRKLGRIQELSRTKPEKCAKVMMEIEDEWGIIVHSKVFDSLFNYTLKAAVFEFDRRLPELVQEQDIKRKAQLFVEVLGGFIELMIKSTPDLQKYVLEAIRRVKLFDYYKVSH